MSSFEALREVTGWVRPGHDHGCKPVEVIPGLWTAHYDEIDSITKLKTETKDAPIRLVVNAALCQCPARDGFFGDDVRVMEIDLEDDPNERKAFDAGKPNCQSRCADPTVAPEKRCAGDILQYFDPVNDAVEDVLASGAHVLIHCKASLSRSAALVIAYLMRSKGMTLLEATSFLKKRWDATWPCDRFAYDLVEYERRLAKPYRMSRSQLVGFAGISAAVGAIVGLAIAGATGGSFASDRRR